MAVPPSDANFQPMSLTEVRDSLKTLIQFGPPRGEEMGQTCSFNSQEMDNKSRVASRKRKLGNNNIVVLASNVGSKNNEQKEEGNTLDAVCAVMPSGVPRPWPSADASTSTTPRPTRTRRATSRWRTRTWS